jgi:pyrroloquinoline-quinone synthase
MDVVAVLDRARAEIDVLEHPFYRRWVAGELTAHELERYAGQYRHVVVALAEASAQAAAGAGPEHEARLRAHADEERAHVAVWDRFAMATRAAASESSAPPESAARSQAAALPRTSTCVDAWTAGQDTLERLAVLYVIEAGQPRVAETKLSGLVEHYGYSEEGPAVEYFRLHAERDRAHARAAAELIGELVAGCDDRAPAAERMRRRARAALWGNWALLDGVLAGAPA